MQLVFLTQNLSIVSPSQRTKLSLLFSKGAMHIFWLVPFIFFSRRTTTDEIAISDQAGLNWFFKIKLRLSASRAIIRQY
jgi:hypothetical protein